MNKKPFRLFHRTRFGTSMSFGTLMFAIFTFCVSLFVSIIMLPLIILAFLIELPQAIGAGIESVSIFWGSLTGEAKSNQLNHLRDLEQTQAEYEEFQRIQFEADWSRPEVSDFQRELGEKLRKDNPGACTISISTNGSKPVIIRNPRASLN
jgi:hypothetical protein